MYEVFIDGRALYYPGDEESVITDAVVNLKLNDSGTFECEVPVTNPEYTNIQNRVSVLQVLKNEKEIFCGEVRESGRDFYGTKNVYAVGELAFLFDSIQPQARYQDVTLEQFLQTMLDIHNSQVEDKKKFYLGVVTVKDPNNSLYRFTNQETTLDCIREKLCDKLGGYLRIRKENGKRFLDLVTLQEYGKHNNQVIEFGENLFDYAETQSALDLYTACIPRGARLENSPIEGLEAYVDIKSVNDGKDYVYSEEAVKRYGWNRCVVTWDDVKEPANLKKKAEDWLKNAQYESLILDLSAADLSVLDRSIDSYDLGDSVPVFSIPHGIDRDFPVQALQFHLQSPGQDRLKLGDIIKLSYTEQNKKQMRVTETRIASAKDTASQANESVKKVEETTAQMLTDYVRASVFEAYKREVNSKISAVYRYKGSVANYAALPIFDREIGDVWNLLDTGANYAWSDFGWDKLSETIDLSGFALKEDIPEVPQKVSDLENDAGYVTDEEIQTDYVDTATFEALEERVKKLEGSDI